MVLESGGDASHFLQGRAQWATLFAGDQLGQRLGILAYSFGGSGQALAADVEIAGPGREGAVCGIHRRVDLLQAGAGGFANDFFAGRVDHPVVVLGRLQATIDQQFIA